MQAVSPSPAPISTGRKLSFFLVTPVSVLALLAIVLALVWSSYQAQHLDRVYTGVSIWNVDLSGLDEAEAAAALGGAFAYFQENGIVLVDPATGQRWERTPAQLGLTFDVDGAVARALAVGRTGSLGERVQAQFGAWYYGAALAPVVIFDEAQVDAAIAELGAVIDRPATDAELVYTGSDFIYTNASAGRILDKADVRQRLLNPVASLQAAEIELLIHEVPPQVTGTGDLAGRIDNIIDQPIEFYLARPLADDDLTRLTVSKETLAQWVRVRMITGADGGATYDVFIDENGFRQWLEPYKRTFFRDPVRARYYFDDATEELVLVEPHVNGRALDVEATLAAFLAHVYTGNRSVPLVTRAIVPEAHSGATAAELGITELLVEQTTYFYGSTPERKHNIARSAVNFYGIVIGPGEEFSFNHFLGEVSPDQGYETGLIILGGRTIEGVGGGVCQVSTTLFQTAFWAGFPIKERQEHGYRVHYYDDGEGPGMDATIFSPLVDFRFINNTPYHLLIENYYDPVAESLTFKFYSTSLGRTVEKFEPIITNVVPPNPDVWEFNEDIPEGEFEQVDWAVEGSDVTIRRVVRNAQGDLLEDDLFISQYIPWQNVYQYGPGYNPPGGG